MKFRITIIFLVFAIVADGQVWLSPFEPADSTNYKTYFRELQTSSRIENIDSASYAVDLIFHLYNSDPENCPAGLLSPFLTRIQNFQLDFFRKTIIGKWQSESLGSTWFNTKEKMIDPNKKFIFTTDKALFYLNDSLVRQTSYSIAGKTGQHFGLPFRKFLIVFSDTKEEWAFHFITEGNLVPFHGSAKKLHLLFNKQPNCACGCLEELYSINADPATDFHDNDRTATVIRN